jgi:hypothetical protein
MVLGAAPSAEFPKVSEELATTIASFRFPPDAPALPPRTGPSLAPRFEGGQPRFVLEFPTGWYRRLPDEDGGSAWALTAFRPYRGAEILVAVSAAPIPFAWKPIEYSVLDALRGDGRVEDMGRTSLGPSGRARALRARVHRGDQVVDVLVALHPVKHHVVEVRAQAPRPAFVALEPELRKIVASFGAAP